jgi:hypothetical protein
VETGQSHFLGANEGDLYKVKSDGSGEPRVVGGPADSLEFEPD